MIVYLPGGSLTAKRPCRAEMFAALHGCACQIPRIGDDSLFHGLYRPRPGWCSGCGGRKGCSGCWEGWALVEVVADAVVSGSDAGAVVFAPRSTAVDDGWARVMQRWCLLGVIASFIAAVGFAYFSLTYPILTPRQARDIMVGVAAGFVCWILGRPLAVLITRGSRSRVIPVLPHGVSVVIPCCNAVHKIEATVRSIVAQEFPHNLEIVLVENNSTDGTWEELQRLSRTYVQVRPYRVQVFKDEYAASVAINYGVARASYEAIVRMDDDTVMSPTMIAEATGVLMSEPTTTAVAVNLRVSNPDRSIATRLQAVEYMLAMELDRRFQLLLGSVLCCSGGLAAFRRSAIIASNGFCSAPKWVSEDLDMTLKCHRLGNVRMAPTSIGYTEVPAAWKGLIKQRYRWAISGAVSFYLHRRGVGRRRYWYDGRVGFFGLPILGAIRVRDMFAIGYLYILVKVGLDGRWEWMAILMGTRVLLMAAQLALMRPIVHARQGAASYWLIPIFVLAYGPILLATRFVGSWVGVVHIHRLRRRQNRLDHEGLDPNFALTRGLELEVVRAARRAPRRPRVAGTITRWARLTFATAWASSLATMLVAGAFAHW